VEDVSPSEARKDEVERQPHPQGTIDSVTLARLIEEVRNSGTYQQPTAYNRMHNRHNRS
jgi:hypothetical protein